ncbi:MAG: helix-turn-helix transcriptional regulator [Lachnospiraceae bacterium]|nr:helix-turn-helix transcriptional regulator [Lachnospiraceae bacterium]
MNRVKSLRTEKGLTQQKLSMDIHVSQQYVSKIENGTSFLTEDIILRLSKYFHVSIAYLLGVTDDRLSEMLKDNKDPDLKKWVEFYYKLNKENQDTVSALSEYFIQTQRKKAEEKE